MNKIAVVLGVAAVATLAGCKDPDYVGRRNRNLENYKAQQIAAEQEAAKEQQAQEPAPEVKTIETKPAEEAPAKVESVEEPKSAPEAKPAPETKPAEAPKAETTTYIVQRGDTLSKISKKYNIKQAAIEKLNPSVKEGKVRIGQKLQLPGKVEVGAQTVPQGAFKAPAAKKDGNAEYKGETTEYIVKEGDVLGKIAYGHGINIRQLKKLNGLTNNNVRVGQKLKVPVVAAAAATEKKAEKKTDKKAEKPVEKKAEKAAKGPLDKPTAEAPKAEETAPAAEPTTVAPAAAPEATGIEAEQPNQEPVKPAAPATMDYTVQEGDDITGISIQYGVAASTIKELNGLADGVQLKPGQIIKLPASEQ